MSWKTAICERAHPADSPHENGGKGYVSGVAFATEAEAVAAGTELLSRWTMPHHAFARESSAEVTYHFDPETMRRPQHIPTGGLIDKILPV